MARRKEIPPELSGDALLAYEKFNGAEAAPEDMPAMVLLCEAWAEMRHAEEQIAKTGTVVKLPNGYPGPTPFVKIRDSARATVIRLLREFGFTPAARAKLVPDPEEKDAELSF